MCWLLISLFILAAFTISPAYSKTWTVEQRQTKLMQDVNAGQKSGKLTAKQSRKLRKKLADVARKKAKMQKNGNGRVSAEDKVKLQSSIDKASSKIKEEKLKED
ncbi:MAG: hypothetical protein SFY67_05300 [Candidatus Melainabacteria bacterium]|nr:hypothetical protein [Candidatus Melainabacteria bacterium]